MERVKFETPNWKELHENGLTAVDMHYHTNYSDSYTDVKLAIKLASKRNVGFAVTDHNVIGGAVDAMKRNADVLIIPGMEISAWDGPHILVYFYDVNDLQQYWTKNIKHMVQRNPHLAIKYDTVRILDSLESENCVISAAHPLGYTGYVRGVQKAIDKGLLQDDIKKRFDAFEVICSGMSHKSNVLAKEYADEAGLGYTGGTDGHMLKEVGNVVTCSEHDDIDGFLDSIRKRTNTIIGTEKTMSMKMGMGMTAFTQYMRYIPSSLSVHMRQRIAKAGKRK